MYDEGTAQRRAGPGLPFARIFGRRPSLRFVLYSVLAAALFLTAMMLLRTHMMLNIALTVLAVFLVFAALFGFSRHMDREDRSSGELPELFSR